MDQTMNRGLGSSTRRTMNGRGVREEREAEVSRHGVGRTGKGPVKVPVGLSRAALGVVESEDEYEDGNASDMSTTVEYQGRNGVDETASDRQSRLRREREIRSAASRAPQPMTKKSVKFADKDRTPINKKEIRRKKTKVKEEEGSWVAKWRPKLTWFV